MGIGAERVKRRLDPESALAAAAVGGGFLCGGESIGALWIRRRLGLGVVGGGGELIGGEIGVRVWRGRRIVEGAIGGGGVIREGGVEGVRIRGIAADGAAEEEAEEAHGGEECVVVMCINPNWGEMREQRVLETL